jgi:hypothetical protein
MPAQRDTETFMQPRTVILTALASGPLIGALLGIAIDPTMKPAPEPAWRAIAPDPIVAEPRRMVDAGPQDLSPTWYMDRMPTWKRRAAMREAAFHDEYYQHYPEPDAEPMDDESVVTVIRGGTVAQASRPRAPSLLDEAAEQAEAAARQANAAMGDVQSAVATAYQPEGQEDERPLITLPEQTGT